MRSLGVGHAESFNSVLDRWGILEAVLDIALALSWREEIIELAVEPKDCSAHGLGLYFISSRGEHTSRL